MVLTSQTWTVSVSPQSFMTPLILNTNFIKRESKIGYQQVSNWNPPDWEPTYSHNHYNMFNLQYDSIFIYPSSKSWNNPGESSLPLNCASALKIHTQRPEQHQIPTKPTTICLIFYKHSTHTKLRHPTRCCCVGLSGRNSRNKKWDSSTRQTGLTFVVNSWAIAHKSWITRCSLRAPGF